jgi:hypothetical protein
MVVLMSICLRRFIFSGAPGSISNRGLDASEHGFDHQPGDQPQQHIAAIADRGFQRLAREVVCVPTK